jgi:hypothetical protein
MKTETSHLANMEHLQLTAKTEDERQKQMQTELSATISIRSSDFTWLQRLYWRKKKLVHSPNLILDNNETQELEQGKT